MAKAHAEKIFLFVFVSTPLSTEIESSTDVLGVLSIFDLRNRPRFGAPGAGMIWRRLMQIFLVDNSMTAIRG